MSKYSFFVDAVVRLPFCNSDEGELVEFIGGNLARKLSNVWRFNFVFIFFWVGSSNDAESSQLILIYEFMLFIHVNGQYSCSQRESEPHNQWVHCHWFRLKSHLARLSLLLVTSSTHKSQFWINAIESDATCNYELGAVAVIQWLYSYVVKIHLFVLNR